MIRENQPMSQQEELEFAISEYLDGALPPEEARALEQCLAADPVARAAMDQYRKLHAALGAFSRTAPLPAMQWDRLADHLSQHVEATSAEGRPAMRLVGSSRESHKTSGVRSLAWVYNASRLAVAACLLMAASLVIYRMGGFTSTSNVAVQPPRPQVAVNERPVVQIQIDSPEAASGKATVDVSISGPTVAEANYDADAGLFDRSSHVMIASEQPSSSADVGFGLPY